jgi:hypothetical protein
MNSETPEQKDRGRSRHHWWVGTNHVRISSQLAHRAKRIQQPTLEELQVEMEELKQMLKMNTMLQQDSTRIKFVVEDKETSA